MKSGHHIEERTIGIRIDLELVENKDTIKEILTDVSSPLTIGVKIEGDRNVEGFIIVER